MEEEEQERPLPEVPVEEMDEGVESLPPRDRAEQKDVGRDKGSPMQLSPSAAAELVPMPSMELVFLTS